MKVLKGVSERFSFSGWNLKAWVKGNKEALKIIVGAVVTLSALYPELLLVNLSAGAGAIVVKAVIDVIDFWSSEVKL